MDARDRQVAHEGVPGRRFRLLNGVRVRLGMRFWA